MTSVSAMIRERRRTVDQRMREAVAGMPDDLEFEEVPLPGYAEKELVAWCDEARAGEETFLYDVLSGHVRDCINIVPRCRRGRERDASAILVCTPAAIEARIDRMLFVHRAVTCAIVAIMCAYAYVMLVVVVIDDPMSVAVCTTCALFPLVYVHTATDVGWSWLRTVQARALQARNPSKA